MQKAKLSPSRSAGVAPTGGCNDFIVARIEMPWLGCRAGL